MTFEGPSLRQSRSAEVAEAAQKAGDRVVATARDLEKLRRVLGESSYVPRHAEINENLARKILSKAAARKE